MSIDRVRRRCVKGWGKMMPLLTNGINAFKIVRDGRKISSLLSSGWSIVPADKPAPPKRAGRPPKKRAAAPRDGAVSGAEERTAG